MTVTGLTSGDKVQWTTSGTHDRVLIENISNADGVSGNDNNTFDIGGFSLTQAQPAPDEKLDFTVQIADADGDTANDSFSIGIDGTGIFDDNHVVGVISPEPQARRLCALGRTAGSLSCISSGRGWMKVKEPDLAAAMSLVWRQAPALLVFSFLANLLCSSAPSAARSTTASCRADRSTRSCG